jgi:hypothetical protein
VLPLNQGLLLEAAIMREPRRWILVTWPKDEQLNRALSYCLSADAAAFYVVLGHSQDDPQLDILPLSFPQAARLLGTCLTRI